MYESGTVYHDLCTVERAKGYFANGELSRVDDPFCFVRSVPLLFRSVSLFLRSLPWCCRNVPWFFRGVPCFVRHVPLFRSRRFFVRSKRFRVLAKRFFVRSKPSLFCSKRFLVLSKPTNETRLESDLQISKFQLRLRIIEIVFVFIVSRQDFGGILTYSMKELFSTIDRLCIVEQHQDF